MKYIYKFVFSVGRNRTYPPAFFAYLFIFLFISDASWAGYCVSGGCHDDIVQVKFPHGPVALEKAGREGCIVCHVPTESKCTTTAGGQFNLSVEMPDLCRKCHDLTVSTRHPTMIGGCALCHNPHGTNAGPPFLIKGMGFGEEESEKAMAPENRPFSRSGGITRDRAITGTKRKKIKIYRDEDYDEDGNTGLSAWGVRTAPSRQTRRRFQRENIKGDLESPGGIVHHLMSGSDRETLTTYLEFQRNLKKAGRPLFKLKKWNNKESGIIYEARLRHTGQETGEEGLWCSRVDLTVNMRLVDDPEIRKLSREVDARFCRHPDRTWRLE